MVTQPQLMLINGKYQPMAQLAGLQLLEPVIQLLHTQLLLLKPASIYE